MYPVPFEYHRPGTLNEALGLLSSLGEDARCLAGGQSLIAAMKLRFVQPSDLIDLSGLQELRGIQLADGELLIGAMVTHSQLENSSLVQDVLPCLARTASVVADPQVRNRGTIGGSLAYNDPSADYPAFILAHDAVMVCVSLDGEREIPAGEWLESLLTSALQENEILTRIKIPLPPPRSGASYVKVSHPASRFAMIGAAAVVAFDEHDICSNIQIGVTGLAEVAERGVTAEAALAGTPLDDEGIDAASRSLAAELPIAGDLVLDEDSKRYLCALTVSRAIKEARDDARGSF